MSSFLICAQISVGKWLRLSICWTGACVLLCTVFNVLLRRLCPTLSAATSGAAFFGSVAVAHCLVWWQAVCGGDAIIQREERQNTFTWTRLAANVWLVGLTVFQLFSLFELLLAALFWNETGANSTWF